MRKLAIPVMIILLMLLPMALVISCQQQQTPATPTPSPTVRNITLADAPELLDLSPLLPATFQHLDAASEGMSNKDLGLGPDFSEVELFLREEPYQVILCYMCPLKSSIQRAVTDALLQDEEQMKSLIRNNLAAGLGEENLELGELEMRIQNPQIGDRAMLGEGFFTAVGVEFGCDVLFFRRGEVYVDIESLYLSLERQPLLPLAKEIEHRISMFSQ